MISFYFCWGERGKQVKSMLGKCQVAGVWSGPWGMSRSFVGWEVGKSHCRPRKQHGQHHGGVNLSSATGDGFSECDVPGTVGAVGDAATETRTWKSGPKCEPRLPPRRAASLTPVSVNFQVRFQATPMTLDSILSPSLDSKGFRYPSCSLG